jgi:hypothetical protein
MNKTTNITLTVFKRISGEIKGILSMGAPRGASPTV